MHYVSVENLEKSFGVRPLFNKLSFHINEGDKIALVARNGAGKSTLLRLLAGQDIPDEGKIWINKDADLAFFEQEPVMMEGKTVLENIFHLDHPTLKIISEYEAALEAQDDARLAKSLQAMDEVNGWDFESRVRQILGKLNIHQLQQNVTTLSGGQRKRIALARTLIDIGFEHRHILLIMDEPTNHLDVGMVEWLEHYLNKEQLTVLLVTHDRYFLDQVCDEIWELEAGNIYVHKGDYQNYLEKKSQREESEQASLDKARNLYRKELEWMRKQPKARTTKSKSRIDNFYEVEKKAHVRLEQQQLVLESKMNRLGGKTVEMKKVYKSYPGKEILKGFDYTFKKGERVGIVGKNGVGKSTFINMIQGLEPSDSGKINIGDTVIFGNYSQTGLEITEDVRIIEYVKNIAESFPLAGGGSLSAAQFLQLFLFSPEQQYTYVSRLSGGEKRRLHLLTVLFRNPNFLILDEPTNDLDLPTLSVLENFLSEFPGCLLIVSHDRYFMDRLVDHLFVFEGEGEVRDFPGNYTQYREWEREKEEDAKEKPEPRQTATTTAPVINKKKLSYKEQREFDGLQTEIANLEKEKQELEQILNNGGTNFEALQKASERIGQITELIDEKEFRWLELSEMIA